MEIRAFTGLEWADPRRWVMFSEKWTRQRCRATPGDRLDRGLEAGMGVAGDHGDALRVVAGGDL